MKYQFEFTAHAKKQFESLDKEMKKRIAAKLRFWVKQTNPLFFAKSTPYLAKVTHRFRVGKYRILCVLEKNRLVIVIVEIGKREQVYK